MVLLVTQYDYNCEWQNSPQVFSELLTKKKCPESFFSEKHNRRDWITRGRQIIKPFRNWKSITSRNFRDLVFVATTYLDCSWPYSFSFFFFCSIVKRLKRNRTRVDASDIARFQRILSSLAVSREEQKREAVNSLRYFRNIWTRSELTAMAATIPCQNNTSLRALQLYAYDKVFLHATLRVMLHWSVQTLIYYHAKLC